MTSTAVQVVPTEAAIKQAIVALIKNNKVEFQQLLADALLKSKPSSSKKEKKKQDNQNELALKKERIPYSEMPFWKANPHLKPLVPEPSKTVSEKEFFDVLKDVQEAFKDVTDGEWDEWLEQLKD
jgi:hypothetical protein